MKFLHLSDLHLGKRIHEFSMLEEQRYILEQILELADQHQVDGFFLCGDIYDKIQPSIEAVELFDHFLTEIRKRNLICCAISGNHDAAERIAYGGRIMADSNIHLSPVYRGSLQTIFLQDEYGELQVHLLPFLKPMHVRAFYPEVAPHDYQAAISKVLQEHPLKEGVRHVLLAHQFVAGSGEEPERSESETQMVGGVDQVDATLFEAFDYVALGHLHSPQKVGRANTRYSGSPLKYSFSEAKHQKSVPLLHFGVKGELEIELLPLNPRRDLRLLQGSIEELLSPEFVATQNTEDYLFITLTDHAVIDAMAKLRSAYPYVMRLEFQQDVESAGQTLWEDGPAVSESPFALFRAFYAQQHQKELSEEAAAVLVPFFQQQEEGKA